MATTDVLAGTPFSINTLPIKASPTPKPAPAPTVAPDLEAQELEAYKQKGQLAELKDEAVLRKEKETAEAQAKTTADYAKAVTEDRTRKLLGEKVKERADTTFVPTKETAADMGLLFTLTNIVGFMIGGKSKGNAQQAMSAMNGMLEGHQKGREDLYKKEKAIFEENTKALDKTIEALDRQFKEAMQLYAVDREAGMAKAQSAIAEHNATFLGDALKKNGLAYSADFLAKAVAQKDKRTLAAQRLKDQEEKRNFQERQFEEQKRHNQAVEAAKLGGGGVGALPKDAKTKDEYRARYEVIKNIEDLESLLKDPKYAKFITPLTKFTPDVIANLQQNFPELQSKLARVQAQEFLIGGKALTAGEQKILEPIYGWRGLTADSLRQRLNETKRSIQTTQVLNEEIYPGFKDLRPKLDAAYENIGKIPTIPQRNIDQVTYEKNQIIRMGDKSYRVIDDSDSTDPELEEVK